MSYPPGMKKNVFRRHPILTGFIVLSVAFFVFAALLPRTEYKKLDYSRPIATDDYAIVCPQTLLFDVRADHDANAVLETFTAFSHRDEKARALGCEVVHGDIPVTAHRMSSPFNDYVSISIPGFESGGFFTMEGDLKNTETPSQSHSVSTEWSSQTATTKANSSQETTTDSLGLPIITSSNESDAAELRQLRWQSLSNRNVVLYGPNGLCATLEPSEISSAYEFTLVLSDGTRHLYSEDRRTEAMQAASDFCIKSDRR